MAMTATEPLRPGAAKSSERRMELAAGMPAQADVHRLLPVPETERARDRRGETTIASAAGPWLLTVSTRRPSPLAIRTRSGSTPLSGPASNRAGSDLAHPLGYTNAIGHDLRTECAHAPRSTPEKVVTPKGVNDRAAELARSAPSLA